MTNERIVAFGFLTRRDLDTLGSSFDRAFPIDKASSFEELILKLDEGDRVGVAMEIDAYAPTRVP